MELLGVASVSSSQTSSNDVRQVLGLFAPLLIPDDGVVVEGWDRLISSFPRGRIVFLLLHFAGTVSLSLIVGDQECMNEGVVRQYYDNE